MNNTLYGITNDKIVDDIEKNFEMFTKIQDIFKLENPGFSPYTEQIPTTVKLNTTE